MRYLLAFCIGSEIENFTVHPVNGEVPPVKGRPRKLPHYANRGKTSSSGGELASARSCFSTVRTALGKLRITGLLAQFDIARSFPQFPRPLLLQPTILTSERGTRFGIRKAPNHVPPPHLPDDPTLRRSSRLLLLAKATLRGLQEAAAEHEDTRGITFFSGSFCIPSVFLAEKRSAGSNFPDSTSNPFNICLRHIRDLAI